MSKKKQNKLGDVWILVALVFIGVIALNSIPDGTYTFTLKKADILSDIRSEQYNQKDHTSGNDLTTDPASDPEQPFTHNVDSLQLTDSTSVNSLGGDSLAIEINDSISTINDSIAEVNRIIKAHNDSIYQQLRDNILTDSVNLLEDFSATHTGLRAFMHSLLNESHTYVAVLGDSFIEGDIFTYDLRKLLQQSFGGAGVGWMPMYSQVSGYRKGIRQTSKGWNEHSILHSHNYKQMLSGSVFTTASEKNRVAFTLPTPLDHNDQALLYYTSKDSLLIQCNSADTTITQIVQPNEQLNVQPLPLHGKKVNMSMAVPNQAQVYGVSFEQQTGVTLDNFALRGNSGYSLLSLNSALLQQLHSLRPYRLIILQYGLNVANEKQHNYRSYGDKMIHAIKNLQSIYPDASVIIMSVSDRGKHRGGNIVTMPGILALRQEQRRIAQACGVMFWDTFAAMGGPDATKVWAANGWMAKDYTHLSFSGGRQLARKMMKSFELERTYYEQSM